MRWRWPCVGWLAEGVIRAGRTAVGWICAAFGLPDVPGAAIIAVSRGAMGRIWRLDLGADRSAVKERARQIDPICASPLASTWGTWRVQAGRRAFSRTSRSLSVMRSVSWRVSGRWWTVPLALNGTVHASAACGWARRPGRGQGSRHPAWRARLPGRGLLPAPGGTCRVSFQIVSARSAGLEFGSDPASRGCLGPIN